MKCSVRCAYVLKIGKITCSGSTGGASSWYVMPLTTETKSGISCDRVPAVDFSCASRVLSGYSCFSSSLKSTQIRTIEGNKFISNHNTVTCYPHKLTLLTNQLTCSHIAGRQIASRYVNRFTHLINA